MADFSQRFLFDDSDVRGELVALHESYQHVLAKHDYPPAVAQLLGELMAAAALLVGTLKFDGLLVLQARSNGAVPLLMVECSSARELRGIARYESAQLGELATLSELMPDGVLAITVEPTQGQRYQGIVDLDGADLAACLTNYFQTSEQLATRFWLHADGRRARGLLLQQLPAETEIAYILNPSLTERDLLAAICDEFQLPYDKDAGLKLLFDLIRDHLLANLAAGKRSVVLVDEAQHLLRHRTHPPGPAGRSTHARGT